MKLPNYFQQLNESHVLVEQMKRDLIRDLNAKGIEHIEIQDSILIQCQHRRYVGNTDGDSTTLWCEDCGQQQLTD